MRAAAAFMLMLSIGLLVGGLMGPPYLRSSLFDRRPTYDRAATEAEEDSWMETRQRQVAGAERFRVFALWIGVPLFLAALVALILA